MDLTLLRTEESFNGRLEIYSTNGTMVSEVALGDRFAPTPVELTLTKFTAWGVQNITCHGR